MTLKLPKDYWSLDFETSGLDHTICDVTETGAVEVRDCQIVRIIHGLGKPIDSAGQQIPLTKKIIELTGITDDLLTNEPSSLENVRKNLFELVHSDLAIIGYNIIAFDRLFIEKYCQLLGWTIPEYTRYIDCAALFKRYRQTHREKSTAWNLPISPKQLFSWSQTILEKSWSADQIKYNLDACINYLCIPQFGIAEQYTCKRHRAVYDAILTHRALERLREEMDL